MKVSGNVKKVMDYIYEQVLNDVWPLGSPISEMEIAQTLKVSRSPVREALKLLEGQGVLTHYPNRGTIVTDMNHRDIEEIFELRIQFELMSLKKACQYMPENLIREIKERIENLNEGLQPEEYYAANTALHNAIVQYSGNERLIRFYDTLSMQVALVNRISGKLPSHFQESRAKHIAIAEAIEKRDYLLAKERLTLHLEEVRDSTLDAFDRRRLMC